MQAHPPSDEWSEWLLNRRHGGNPDYEAIVPGVVDRYADRVLDGAQLFPGMTLVDVGTGDGLLALRAIERIGPTLRAVHLQIHIDVAPPLSNSWEVFLASSPRTVQVVTCRSLTTVFVGRAVLQNWRMIHSALSRAALLLIMGINPLWVGSARAALGGDAASVHVDAGPHGMISSTSLPQYDIDEITDPSEMRVREYVNRAGIVFAVAWSGPAPPDLEQLLGTHFAQYTTALAALDHPGLHRAVRIDSAGLVVEAGGHLRAYSGRAYLTALIPAGVSSAELR